MSHDAFTGGNRSLVADHHRKDARAFGRSARPGGPAVRENDDEVRSWSKRRRQSDSFTKVGPTSPHKLDELCSTDSLRILGEAVTCNYGDELGLRGPQDAPKLSCGGIQQRLVHRRRGIENDSYRRSQPASAGVKESVLR